MLGRSAMLVLFAVLLSIPATMPAAGAIQNLLPPTPDWQNAPGGRYGTGLAVADLNHDGLVDFVVANGNDMGRQHVTVWLNRGDGTYNLNPSWTSSDIDYQGHCDLADVDGDGILDLAVAVYLGPSGFGSPGRVKLYKGLSNGTFSPNPVWQSADSFYCFSVAFGDIDMDGRPDLACATGDDYYSHAERCRVYRDVNGMLETIPSWTSNDAAYSLDVTWADFNNDGYLDLAFAGSSGPCRIYFSQGGTLQRTARWTSTDASDYANTCAVGDYDGDGWIDLAVADNNQLGGTGHFKLYNNLGTGMLTTTPAWQSAWGGYGSSVSFVDLDEDGDLDLSTGSWWGPVQIYENVSGTYAAAPAYESNTSSVIENEVWEDVDNDGLQSGLIANWTGDGAKKLFNFPVRPVRSILTMSVDSVPVDVHSLYLNRDNAWVILPWAPAAGSSVRATYVSSADVDLLLSNWDDTIGEYLFRNTRNPSDVATDVPISGILRLMAGPNPSDGPVRICLAGAGERPETGIVEIFDVAGRRLREWHADGALLHWDGRDAAGRALPGGVYLIRWSRPSDRMTPLTTRVILR